MVNLHCNKNGEKKTITEIRIQEVWVQNPPKCPLRYGGADGFNRKIIINLCYSVINRGVGKMCNPHPRKSIALGKHM